MRVPLRATYLAIAFLLTVSTAIAQPATFVELPLGFRNPRASGSVVGDVVYGQFLVGSVWKAARWSPTEGVTVLYPGDPATDYVVACSGDGNVAVAVFGTPENHEGNARSYRYVHASGGGQALPLAYTDPISGSQPSQLIAESCSLDGSVVVGWFQMGRRFAFRWSAQTGMVVIPKLGAPPYIDNYARSCSDDGVTTVGVDVNGGDEEPFIHTLALGVVKLTPLEVRFYNTAIRISGNGKAVVFTNNPYGPYGPPVFADQPVRWTSAGVVECGTLGKGAHAERISVDGSAIIGSWYDNSNFQHAFVWTAEDGVMADLGTFGGTSAFATGLSSRGRIVVGNANQVSGSEAFVYTKAEGLEALRPLALAAMPADTNIPLWRFGIARCLSRDGVHCFIEGERLGTPRVGYLRLIPPGGPDVNQAPTILTAVQEDQTVEVHLGATFTTTFTGVDTDGDNLTLAASILPTSATLNPPTGTAKKSPFATTFRFTPTLTDVGTRDVSVSFSDAVGTAQRSFKLYVPENAAPTIGDIAPLTVECEGSRNLVTLNTVVSDPDAEQKLTVKWFVNNVLSRTRTQQAVGSTQTETIDFKDGGNQVRVEVADSYGGTTSVSTTVTVQDTEAPSVTVAANKIVPTDAGKAFATNVSLGAPTVFDKCDGEPTLENDAPIRFQLGVTTVTWTATDADGNSSTATQTVTVADREAPKLSTVQDIERLVDRGKGFATISLDVPTATDNVTDDLEVTSDAKPTYPIGTTTVSFKVKDGAGNVAQRTAKITVVNRSPKIVAKNVSKTTRSERGVRVQLNASGTIDPDGHKLKYDWSAGRVRLNGRTGPKPSGLFPVGTTIITLTVTDPFVGEATKTVRVKVKLRGGSKRSFGAEADVAFSDAADSAYDSFASGDGGPHSGVGLQHIRAAERLGILAGDTVLWGEGTARDEMIRYAGLRDLQRTLGAAAATELVASFAESGDPRAFEAYRSVVFGTEFAKIDIGEP